MPELPEVETVARGLRQTIPGRRIVAVRLGKTDFIDDPAALERHLPGRRIDSVERFGKFMLLGLSTAAPSDSAQDQGNEPAALLVHLGMTGHLAPQAAAEPHQKHTHLWLELDDGRELRYTDPRRFGRIAYLAGDRLRDELQRFGAEPLQIGAEEFATRIRSRRARIKALLLDQSVLRGVGNIYADESLWRAKIHPARLGSSLSSRQAQDLRRALQEVLRHAIAMRGSSISNFADAQGQPGEYQRRHRAYGREGKPCYRCRTAIRRVMVAGRSSHFCPTCQSKAKPRQTKQKKSQNARRRTVKVAKRGTG
jgi:formamidopyrimidine-DNA glycosylase